MGTVANDRPDPRPDLPDAQADPGPPVPPIAAAPVRGLSVRAVLDLPVLIDSRLVAGRSGIAREVTRVNVMEVPDIVPWMKPYELLLTTGFPLPRADGAPDPAALVELLRELYNAGVAGVGVKMGRYLDEIPVEALAVADELGLPLFTMSPDTAFDDVIGGLFNALLDVQSRALASADALHRALAAIVLEGGGLDDIAAELASVADASVLICTADGRVQSTAGSERLSSVLAGLPLYDHTGRFHTERVHQGTEHDPQGIPGELIVASIVAGGVDHGRIVAFRGRAAAESRGALVDGGGDAGDILQWLERAATVAALAITRDLAVAAVESKYRGDYLRDVLLGTAGSSDQVAEHCRELDWDIERPTIAIVASLDDGVRGVSHPRVAQDRFASAWRQVLRARDRRAPVVGFSHEVVALVPCDRPEDVERIVGEIVDSVTGDRGGGRNSFSAGVSRVIAGPAGIAAGYEQARKAVAVGRRVRGPGGVSHFDALGVYRLLSLIPDGAELRAFAEEVLGVLAADTPDSIDLRTTLQCLLDTNLNVAETARTLHFHYNTLRYRIGKLEGIVGPFTTDPHLRLNVALALQVVHMRGI